MNTINVLAGTHYPEPPYQLYSCVNPVMYLCIFITDRCVCACVCVRVRVRVCVCACLVVSIAQSLDFFV